MIPFCSLWIRNHTRQNKIAPNFNHLNFQAVVRFSLVKKGKNNLWKFIVWSWSVSIWIQWPPHIHIPKKSSHIPGHSKQQQNQPKWKLCIVKPIKFQAILIDGVERTSSSSNSKRAKLTNFSNWFSGRLFDCKRTAAETMMEKSAPFLNICRLSLSLWLWHTMYGHQLQLLPFFSVR